MKISFFSGKREQQNKAKPKSDLVFEGAEPGVRLSL
jgi:hypothetical protein